MASANIFEIRQLNDNHDISLMVRLCPIHFLCICVPHRHDSFLCTECAWKISDLHFRKPFQTRSHFLVHFHFQLIYNSFLGTCSNFRTAKFFRKPFQTRVEAPFMHRIPGYALRPGADISLMCLTDLDPCRFLAVLQTMLVEMNTARENVMAIPARKKQRSC